jgi:hypothetical protein
MSFDLGVWCCDEPLTDKQAGEIYLQLCEQWPYLEGDSPAVAVFYQELIEHWPEIDTVPEEKVGEFDFSPWSCELCHSGMAVVMSCVWSKADDVAQYVKALALKHDLLLFDPQANRVTLPERFKSAKRGLLQRLLGRPE